MTPAPRSKVHRGWPAGLALAGGLLAALCALAPFALAVAGTRLSSYDSGQPVINACVSFVMQPKPIVGLSWEPPSNPKIERTAWIRTYRNMVCGRVPWIAAMPRQGLLAVHPEEPPWR